MLTIYYSGGSNQTLLFILLMAVIGLSMYANFKVSSNFSKYSKVKSYKGLTGREVAKLILERKGIYGVNIQPVSGNLTDHYDPRTKTLRLSYNVYNSDSISAISVAAHEVGHAVQHDEGYIFLRFRSSLAPMVSFSSQFVIYLIFAGFFLRMTNLIDVGIVLFSFSVLFHIITLPVELNASKRAMNELDINNVIINDEKYAIRKVLGAAAMTYVASMLTSIIQLLRFISMRKD